MIKLMKKNVKKILTMPRRLYVGAVSLLMLIALTGASLAWYGELRESNVKLAGSITYVARYFESGNGKSSAEIVSGYDAEGNAQYNDGYDKAKHEDASTEAAYEIKTPEQLYNLAWLQYMGYFNDEAVYFYLSADLDMDGYVLPPIGTAKYPFVGSFDGNGYTIKNLTVSNSLTYTTDDGKTPMQYDSGDEKSEMPLQAYEELDDSGDIAGVEIIGLFGVVGDYSGGATYDSAVSTIKDVKIEGISIVGKTTKCLAGLAAGYVNGTVSGVTVTGSIDGSTATSGVDVGKTESGTTITTEKLSYYTTVGYCTDTYLASIDVTDVTHDVSVKQGTYDTSLIDGRAWGGSIDMKSLYTRLSNVFNHVYNSGNAAESNKWYYYTKGSLTDEDTGIVYDTSSKKYGAVSYTQSTGAWDGYYNYSDTHSTYSFPAYNQNYQRSSSYTKKYVFTYGADQTSKRASDTLTLTVNADLTCTETTISQDGEYLSRTGSGSSYAVASATTTGDDTTWLIATIDGDQKIIFFKNGGVNYYLSIDNSGALAISASMFLWTQHTGTADDGTVKTDYANNGRYLYCDNGTWTVKSAGATFAIKGPKYSIFYPYVTCKNGNGGNAFSSGKQIWSMDASGILKATYKDVIYYLGVSNGEVCTYTDSSRAANWTLSVAGDGATVSTTGGTVYYDGSKWYVGSSTSKLGTTESYTIVSTDNNLTTTGDSTQPVHVEGTVSSTPLYQINDSIFPIGVASSTSDGYSYITGDTNTGYFVSGAENGGDNYGNLRTALYGIGDALKNATGSSSYTTSMKVLSPKFNTSTGGFSFQQVSDTNTDGKFTPTTTGNDGLSLEKYAAARTAAHTLLNGEKSVYGIHFMNAAISRDNLATISTARIQNVKDAYGNNPADYEVPRNSIDFRLLTSGYINFFAHTGYVSGDRNDTNNCFFSLHHIYRDNEYKITDIKEISKIYKDTDGNYVYLYKGDTPTYSVRTQSGNYDTPTSTAPDCATNANLVFDTACLTNPGMTTAMLYSVYYFEIPVNAGEYALGSVEGEATIDDTSYTANGAYLFYLDISANAKYETLTATKEVITSAAKAYEYPIGVGFGSSTSAVEDAAVSVPLGETVSAAAVTGSGVVTITTSPDSSDAVADAACSYAASGVTVKNGSDTMTAMATGSTDPVEKTIYRLDTNGTAVECTKEKYDSCNVDQVWTDVRVASYSYDRKSDVTVDITAAFTYKDSTSAEPCKDDITVKATGDSITISNIKTIGSHEGKEVKVYINEEEIKSDTKSIDVPQSTSDTSGT